MNVGVHALPITPTSPSDEACNSIAYRKRLLSWNITNVGEVHANIGAFISTLSRMTYDIYKLFSSLFIFLLNFLYFFLILYPNCKN